MDRMPDGNSAALSRYMSEQDRAEREFADNLPARRQEALDALEDEKLLLAVINDEELAVPLARIFRNLDRAFSGDVPARDAVLQASEQMKKQCYQWLMEAE